MFHTITTSWKFLHFLLVTITFHRSSIRLNLHPTYSKCCLMPCHYNHGKLNHLSHIQWNCTTSHKSYYLIHIDYQSTFVSTQLTYHSTDWFTLLTKEKLIFRSDLMNKLHMINCLFMVCFLNHDKCITKFKSSWPTTTINKPDVNKVGWTY
jgi:hypothetical protein